LCNNTVPTVSQHLHTSGSLLDLAPCSAEGPESQFTTEAMQILDEVLLNMDDPEYDMPGFDQGLKRVMHAFHMQEVYQEALPYYRQFAAQPPRRRFAIVQRTRTAMESHL
jgi:hypothetical protein